MMEVCLPYEFYIPKYIRLNLLFGKKCTHSSDSSICVLNRYLIKEGSQ